MYVLAVETATPVAGAAVIDEQKVLAEIITNNQKTHSQNLLPMIEQVLQNSGITLSDLDVLVVSSGPGSFTGLRIGLSTIRTLAQVTGIPLVGVSTLDNLAWKALGFGGLICPVLNAKKNEVYTAIYKSDKRRIERLTDYQACSPELLLNELKLYNKEVVFLGDGLPVYKPLFQKQLGDFFIDDLLSGDIPNPSVSAWLGLQKFRQGKTEDPYSFLPYYIRKSEAERKKQAKDAANCAAVNAEVGDAATESAADNVVRS